MKTPIDFGKDFLNTYFDQRDADACHKMLAGDLVWITPENMHHFLSEGAVLKYLRKKVKAETEARYVDLISIKSSPSADNIITVAYEINLVSREEERPLYLRCSMVICRRSKRLEITFLHFSKKSERDSSEQLRAFISNLPCGVMILACLDGRREEAIFYNEYFAQKLRYRQEEFARAMAQNPFFMASEEDRDRIHEQISEARKNGGSITANLRFYRRDGNSFYYRMKGAPAYQANGGTVYYCVFQETTGFQMTTDRLQGRLDTAAEILRQIPEAFCGIEYPPGKAAEKARTVSENASADGMAEDRDGDVKIYRGRGKGGRAAGLIAAAKESPGMTAATEESAGTTVVAMAKESAGTTAVVTVKESAGKAAFEKTSVVGETPGKSGGAVQAASGDTVVVDVTAGKTGGAVNKASGKTGTPAYTADGGAGKGTKAGPKVFFTSKNIPSMFGVSNSMYIKNILEDPFYGLEITSITRDRLMSSSILNPEKAVTGKAVSCGIFRVKRPDQAEEKAIRVELVARRVKDKDGTVRLYLFYYDREEAQRDLENRVDRAMKMGRAGQDQLRADLRKAKENAARRQSELTADMKKAEEKHAAELSRIENNLAEEKKRGVLMSRQLEDSKAAQKQLTAERERIEEDASRRIRIHEARADLRVKEACSARDLLEEQLREAQVRSRSLEQQLQRERARRLLLEEQFRQLQEQNEELKKERKESAGDAPIKIAESISATLLSPAASEEDIMHVAMDSGSVRTAAATAVGTREGDNKHVAVESAGARTAATAVGTREGDWMTRNESLTVFSSIDPVVDTGNKPAADIPLNPSADSTHKDAPKPVADIGTDPAADSATFIVMNPIGETASDADPEERVVRLEKWILAREHDKAESRLRTLMERVNTLLPDSEGIVNDFREAASSDRDVLKEKQFSPDTLIQNIIIYEGIACADKKVSLRLFKDSRLPSDVTGFVSLLLRALCEVIENAISRAKTGGNISVHCRADRPSSGLVNLHFRIDDNGIGIPETEMRNIFKAQHREDGNTIVHSGLYAARQAATLMGGSIHARSGPVGTRFLLNIALRV